MRSCHLLQLGDDDGGGHDVDDDDDVENEGQWHDGDGDYDYDDDAPFPPVPLPEFPGQHNRQRRDQQWRLLSRSRRLRRDQCDY